jgi:hypothetical protein
MTASNEWPELTVANLPSALVNVTVSARESLAAAPR